MIGDVNFSDLIRIYQIRSKPKGSKPPQPNKNFEEFTDVYKEVFQTGVVPDSSRLKYSYGGVRSKYSERYPNRPLHDIKKIHIEMPVLGSERAIVSGPILPPAKTKKRVEMRDNAVLTENRITKWVKKDSIKPIKIQRECGSVTDTQLFIQQTRHEINESQVQLEAIKSIINKIQIKPSEKVRKLRPPTFKAKKKPDRHSECISRRYMSTLNTMQQKLQKLEEKYFGKPHIVYKNVKDICTTYSNLDILHRDNSSSVDVDLSQTLTGIKQELDDMANSASMREEKKPKSKTVTFKAPEVEFNTVGDTYDAERNITPMNFSFKRPMTFEEEEDNFVEQEVNYVKIIDQSESWFRKYQNLTKDVEEFCEELDKFDKEDTRKDKEIKDVEEQDSKSATEESDKESHDSDVDHFYSKDSPSFLSKDLQAVISSSSYLSKEFKKQPNVKIFTNSERYVHNKYFGVPSSTSTNIDASITNLIENLSMSLKDSIYYRPG